MQRDAGRAEVLDAQAGGEYVLADLVHDEDFPCRELCGCRRCVECEERLESGPLLVAQGRSGGGRHGCEGGAVKGGLCSWQLARASVEHTERETERRVTFDVRLLKVATLPVPLPFALPFSLHEHSLRQAN